MRERSDRSAVPPGPGPGSGDTKRLRVLLVVAVLVTMAWAVLDLAGDMGRLEALSGSESTLPPADGRIAQAVDTVPGPAGPSAESAVELPSWVFLSIVSLLVCAMGWLEIRCRNPARARELGIAGTFLGGIVVVTGRLEALLGAAGVAAGIAVWFEGSRGLHGERLPEGAPAPRGAPGGGTPCPALVRCGLVGLAVLTAAVGILASRVEGRLDQVSSFRPPPFIPWTPFGGAMEFLGTALLLFCPLFPLVFAWSHLEVRRLRAASRWAVVALLAAGVVLLLASWDLLESLRTSASVGWALADQDILDELGGPHPPDPAPPRVLSLAPGVIAALFAWWILRSARSRLEAPPERPLAGTHAPSAPRARRP